MVSQRSSVGAAAESTPRIGFLTRPNEGRFVVQDFARFPVSLEWELGQAYLSACGTKGFVQDKTPIPFAINNDGALSRNAADVFFESLLAADEAGSLDPEIFVLELGIGLGLFAHVFLDAVRERSATEGKDYYDRLHYVAGDYSGRMLLDACRHGIFENHPGRYLLRPVNALDPAAHLRGDALLGQRERAFQAMFLIGLDHPADPGVIQ